MNDDKSTCALDYLKSAHYYAEVIHPLFIKVYEAEQTVYIGLFKKSRASKTVLMYEKIMNRALDPISYLSVNVPLGKDKGKEYGESILLMYRLFISICESRIQVLKEFIANGMSQKCFDINNDSLEMIKQLDNVFESVSNKTKMLTSIFQSMGIY